MWTSVFPETRREKLILVDLVNTLAVVDSIMLMIMSICYPRNYLSITSLEKKVLRTSNPCFTSVLTVRFKSNDMSSV